MIFKRIFIIFILYCIPWFTYGDMNIEITTGTDTAYPIAVVPFTTHYQDNLDYKTKNIGLIIASDLRNSGKFNILPISYLPHQPSKLADIIPMFWEKLGINTIVLGSVNIDNNKNYIITYQLIDTSNNPALVILENQYLAKECELRYIAHTISNEIFKKLTGIQGIFCTRIAYISYIHNSLYPYELCISDYDGYNQKSIYRSKEPLMSPAWSVDGKKIAYVSFDSGFSKIVIQNLDTGLIYHTIKFSNHNGSPVFSPDGKKLAFSLSKTGSLNLYIMYLSSGKIYQITSNRYNNTEPSWFPDSENLAYTSDQGGMPQIYKINIYNTTNIHRISWLHGSNQNPNVSSDGTFIIMVNRNYGKQKISKLNLLNGQEEILTTDSKTFLADTPSISPNDMMLIYSTILTKKVSANSSDANHSKSILELISIDGKFKACLEGSLGNIRFPTWSISDFKKE